MNADIWHYAFVQQALAAGVITAVTTGVVGPFVVARNLGFAVHGLAEVGFTGAAETAATRTPSSAEAPISTAPAAPVNPTSASP